VSFFLGDLYALLTAFCWSSAVILFDFSSRSFSSLQISLIKNLIGVIGFIITVFLLKVSIFEYSSNEILILILSGLLGVAIGDLLFLKSLSIVGSGISAIIATIYAPSIFFFAFILFGEVITIKVIIGGILISIAIFVGTFENSRILKRKLLLQAIIYGILSQILTAVSVLMVRPIMENNSVVSIALIRFGTGLIATILYLLISRGMFFLKKTFRDGLINPYIILGSIFGTYLSVIFWLLGFKYTLASRAAVYNELSTIIIIIMASLFLNESMTGRKWFAVLVAFLGALIVGLN